MGAIPGASASAAIHGHGRLAVRSIPVTARWGLHSHAAGRTWWTPNQHPPWPLHTAEVLHLDEDLVHRAGFDARAESMLRPLFSPGVYTTFGLPRAL